MATKTYEELRIPKGGAKAFAAALAEQNDMNYLDPGGVLVFDMNAPAKRKSGSGAKKSTSAKTSAPKKKCK